MNDSPIIYEKKGRVAYITLNRPQRMNALSEEMRLPLKASWADVKDDKNVWVVIVTGAGDRAFTTGMDVKDAASSGGPAAKGRSPDVRDRDLTALQNDIWKPVITAINGVCAGGGLHFIADSDITICADSATFLDPHVSVGQVSALEAIALSRRIPLSAIMRMMLMGRSERLSADQALQLGLVSQVVPFAELMPTAESIAQKITQNSLAAMMASKRAIIESLSMGLGDGLQHGWDVLREHWQHPDYMEGPRAWVERREANWTVD